MISQDHKEYYKFVDDSIREHLFLGREIPDEKEYFGFFEPDLEAIKEDDPEEQQFKVDAANFIENAFHLGVLPGSLGNILADVLIERGWCA
jgi:hypothetical protein